MTRIQYLGAHRKQQRLTFAEFEREYIPSDPATSTKPFYTWSKLKFEDGTLIVPSLIFAHPNLIGHVSTQKKIETFAPIVLL